MCTGFPMLCMIAGRRDSCVTLRLGQRPRPLVAHDDARQQSMRCSWDLVYLCDLDLIHGGGPLPVSDPCSLTPSFLPRPLGPARPLSSLLLSRDSQRAAVAQALRPCARRCGRAGPQRMGANFSGRHRRRQPGMVSIGSRTQVFHSRTGCANRMYGETVGGEHEGAAQGLTPSRPEV